MRYAFTRFGVPYVVSIQCLDFGAARAAAGLPRGLSRRRTFPEGAAHRRRPAVAAAQGHSLRDRRTAGGARRPNSPIARPATSSPKPAPASKAAAPTSPPIRRSGFRCEKAPRRPLAVDSAGARRPDCAAGAYPWRDNFCEARSFQRRPMRQRLWPSGPGHPARRVPGRQRTTAASLRPQAAGRSSRCATAS